MILTPLLAAGAAIAVGAQSPGPSPEEDILLSADAVYRESEGGPLVAEGDVRAQSGGQFLRADRVVYDEANDTVIAVGNVAVRDEGGQLYFAEEVQLSGDLENGIVAGFEAELAPNGKLAASTAIRRESGRNELRKATYTLCPVCDTGFRRDRPVWQVKARRVIQDEEAQVLRFRSAFVEILGVPMMYIPWLQVPDPSVRRQSGFLAPQIGNSTRVGVEVEVPYYLAISDYQDFTFAPRHMTNLGTLIKGEWRRNTWNSRGVVQGGFISPTNDLSQEPGDPDDFRWHFFGLYERELAGGWDLEADIDQVSDKGYLRTYDIEPVGDLREAIGIFRPDRLESNVTFARRNEDATTEISALTFQTLRFNEDQEFTANALPRIRHERSFDVLGGEIDLGGNLLVLNREQGLDTLRASTHAEYSAVHFTASGHRFETFAELRGDAYAYRDATRGIQACNVEDRFYDTCRDLLPRDLAEDRFQTYRFLPTVGAEWSYPVARLGEFASVIIEPRVQAVISPDRNFQDDVFNEDSQFFQFDNVTLFDYSKATGLDQWEDGQRLNVGLSTTTVLGDFFTLNSTFGLQLRAEETEAFDDDTGLGETVSDVVGAVEMRLGGNFVFDNRVRIDDNTGAFRRVESTATGRLGPLSGGMTYLRVENDEIGNQQKLDEFLTVRGGLTVNRNVSFAFSQAQNLDSGNTSNTQIAMRLQNDCLAVSVRYLFDDSTIDGFEQNRSILVKFDILGFD